MFGQSFVFRVRHAVQETLTIDVITPSFMQAAQWMASARRPASMQLPVGVQHGKM